MLRMVKQRISLKMTLTLVTCLAVILGLLSLYVIDSRQQAIEQELIAKGRMAALVGAQTFSQFLEETVVDGHLTEAEIFDENYQLITTGPLSGAKIPKYHTLYDRYLDSRIRTIEDAFLTDNMVVFAVLVDRNGYLPTHNSVYSKPLTGDPEQDRVGNRTKRLFNDPVGLAAGRFQGGADEPVLKQIYPRDTGVLMWDLTAPVFVKGRHWGGFRIGFSMEKTEASIGNLRQTVVFASLGALIVCALVIMFSVGKYTRPLQELTGAVQAVASGRRKEKIDLQSSDEIGVLVAAFNQMSDTLEQTTVSRDFYDMLVRSMHDLLIVTDKQGRIVSVNQASCGVLGYDEDALLTLQVQNLVVLRDDNHDWFAQQVTVSQNYMADVVLKSFSGDQVPMAMSCSRLVDDDATLSGFILVLQDNSARIEAEQAKSKAFEQAFKFNEELRRVNDAMEEKNLELEGAYKQLKDSQVQILQQEKMASIGQLAAGVAHEINNPMGFITSNIGTLGKYFDRMKIFLDHQQKLIDEKTVAEDHQEIKAERKKLKIDYLIEDSRDLIEESLDGADRVKAIVQNLKTFSRIDQEQEHDADINQCLETTLSIAWNELKYKVTLEKDFGSLPLLKCYPQKLNQVFMNLLVNGAQAIEDKGIIKIRTWHEQDDIFVSISDTGSGIAEENLVRIFEPFFTTKEVGKGTGLGMSISYEIIKEHGGEITVASTVGEGTIFTIRLPLNTQQEGSARETDD